MLLKNINTALYTNCSRITYTRGRDLKELKKFMEELITVKSNGTVPMEELLEARSRLISRGSSIIIVTPGLGSRLSDKLAQLKEAGFDVIVVYITVESSSNEQLKGHMDLLEGLNIRTYRVGINDDVRTSLEG
jgi:vacuolar-type H+-ATPase subunit F/Vma7